uniref:Translation elongation factor EF1B beta/delta subunit guanine nucleotide exchange domain-containing protein n=1 Tax=Aegilops tauschii subsp. strangulata TaxID=200361 RepID=A0A453B3W1_AEGTS
MLLRLLQLMMTMTAMLTFLERKPRRRKRQLKSALPKQRLLPRRKNVLSISEESGKSSVLLDVKPWDDETDMVKLEEAVRSIKMEGLLWGASKLMPVGYGIKKLQIMMTIIDDLVSVDTLIEDHLCVEPANEYIQSCDIVAFNKI